jgi:hypothetical protein
VTSFTARTGLWLVLSISCLAFTPNSASAGFRLDVDPAWRSAGSVPALIDVLESWLDRHAPWPRRAHSPAVRLISPERVAGLAGPSGRGHGTRRGLYDPETDTIYLVRPWDLEEAEDVAVLLHELVHHRQAPHHWYCAGAQEPPAYRLQDAWLAERGLQAEVNWIAVILEGGCQRRDFHPD